VLLAYGSGEVLLSMLWFFLFFIWIMLLFVVFGDLFRSHDLSGVAKTLWIIGIILFPYLGVFVYLIARGNKMTEHAQAAAAAQDKAAKAYIKETVGAGSSPADQLARLADLKDRGVIDDAEFQKMKAQIVS